VDLITEAATSFTVPNCGLQTASRRRVGQRLR